MLELRHLTKSYKVGDTVTKALDDVSLAFPDTGFVSILGPSGSGKTTLLNIIGGLDHYDSGDLLLDGRSTKDFSETDWDAYRNNSVGFIFQSYNLIPHLSVVENVELGMRLSGVKSAERREKAVAALRQVGLAAQIHKRPNQLSGGQMQRVAIARAVADDPKILLCDEPTGALDSVTSVQVMDLIRSLSEDRLVIMVTHNEELAKQYSTRIIRLRDGHITADSDPLDLSESSKKHEALKLKRTRMGYGSAIALSFTNLLTKKGRTFLTALASSIGIISIAVVLSLSGGFQTQIDQVMSRTLGRYPVSITRTAVDQKGMTSQADKNRASLSRTKNTVSHTHLTASANQMLQSVHINTITQKYVDYVKKINPDAASDITLQRSTQLNVLTKDSDGTVRQVSFSGAAAVAATEAQNGTASGSTGASATGSAGPKKSAGTTGTGTAGASGSASAQQNQQARQNGSTGSLTAGQGTGTASGATGTSGAATGTGSSTTATGTASDTLTQSAQTSQQMANANGVASTVFPTPVNGKKGSFLRGNYNLLKGSWPKSATDVVLVVDGDDEIPSPTLRALGIDANDGQKITFDSILGKDFRIVTNDDWYMKLPTGTYAPNTPNADLFDKAGIRLKVTGVIQPKPQGAMELLSPGIAYSNELTDKVINANKNSQIVTDQKTSGTSVLTGAPLDSSSRTQTLAALGGSSLPESILVYPRNFDSKDKVLHYLDAWNKGKKKADRIYYTDMSGMVTDLTGGLISGITDVLVAFAAISLITSMLMIGILTYTSVIERTKEIGVLKALGARKRDVTRVFDSETFLLGVFSGVLGVGIAYLLDIPLNQALQRLTGLVGVAYLDPRNAVILILVSTVLTLLGGHIPALMAARRDAAVALRSE